MSKEKNKGKRQAPTANNQSERTFEQRVADTILQGATTRKTFDVEGFSFTITDPTPATLMMISAEISQLPKVNLQAENILQEVLTIAKDTHMLGRIAAILILGAKRIKQHNTITTAKRKRVWSWRKFKKVERNYSLKTIEEIDWLSNYILDNLTIKTLAAFISARLSEMQIGDFFGLTTSLSAVNTLKATKEVETVRGE